MPTHVCLHPLQTTVFRVEWNRHSPLTSLCREPVLLQPVSTLYGFAVRLDGMLELPFSPTLLCPIEHVPVCSVSLNLGV